MVTFKAGKYYLGDLCYVMHGEWDEFCQDHIEYPWCIYCSLPKSNKPANCSRNC